jgi:hypothetical protein
LSGVTSLVACAQASRSGLESLLIIASAVPIAEGILVHFVQEVS